MSKIIFVVTFIFSAVTFAEELHKFTASVNAKELSCSQLQQSMANRGFVCVQSVWFKDWCTMHVMTSGQCGSLAAHPSYANSKDGLCYLAYVCMPRGNDGQ